VLVIQNCDCSLPGTDFLPDKRRFGASAKISEPYRKLRGGEAAAGDAISRGSVLIFAEGWLGC
jgi:hypothetical protein